MKKGKKLYEGKAKIMLFPTIVQIKIIQYHLKIILFTYPIPEDIIMMGRLISLEQ